MNRIGTYAVGVMLSLGLVIPAGAQNQTPSSTQSASSGQSLGDYARQVRKTSDGSGKPKVFDNDNLPTTDKLSIVGKAAEPSATPAPADTEESAKAPAGDREKKEGATAGTATGNDNKGATKNEDDATREAALKQWTDKINAEKDQVDLLSRELDVLQREYQIRAAAMYADAGNRLRNSGDWDKQDAQYKQQIADKQKALDEAKEKLDDVQEDARKAGMPPSVQQP